MNNQLPIITRCQINKVIFEVSIPAGGKLIHVGCHGKIPDIFRTSRFGELIELELPDAKVTDKEFQNWLTPYRQANPSLEKQLLDVAKCN